MLALLVLVAFVAQVSGKCDNACSGHGVCTARGICSCYDNWGLGLAHLSGDCSQRVCPFELAWVDSPSQDGTFHKYAECSNRGICNRDTGDCECFPGYEGKACARTTCPNGCSGHGQCRDIEDMPFASTPADYSVGYFYANKNEGHTFRDSYKKWDYGKTRGCVCDPEYMDVDCSKRMCMYGTDVMDQRDNMLVAGKYQVQHIHLQVEALNNVYDKNNLALPNPRTFALTFKSKLNETFTTLPIVLKANNAGLHDFVLDVTNALMGLPNNVIDHVKVQAIMNTGSTPGQFSFFDQTNTATPIASFTLTTTSYTVSTTNAVTSNLVGQVVSGTGIPFGTTVTAVSTSAKTVTLSLMPTADLSGVSLTFTTYVAGVRQIGSNLITNHNYIYLNITFDGNNVQGPQHPLMVKDILCDDGCTPKLSGLNLLPSTQNVTEIQMSDYNSFECGRRGKCDYTSGQCSCFSGYTGLSCNVITSLV